MEKIIKQMEILYLELQYVKLENVLMKNIDESINNGEIYIEKYKTIIFCIKDSLWYSIITRMAKICEESKDSNNIFKILNSLKSNPEIANSKNFNLEEIKKIINNIKKAINYDEKNKDKMEIKIWRDKYLVHLDKCAESPTQMQDLALITRSKLEHIIDVLSKSFQFIFNKLKIQISEDDINFKLKILEDVEYKAFKEKLSK